MRWVPVYCEIGDVRTINKFLFLPRTINGQSRWLEWARIKQEYRPGSWSDGPYWEDIEWVDD